MGNYAIRAGLKSMNQPLLVTAYTNLLDPYMLTGRPDEARNCLNAAKEWLAHDRSRFSRICLLVEEADLHLMSGEPDLVLDVLEQIERESAGRQVVYQLGLMIKLRVYRAKLMNREDEALAIATNVPSNLCDEYPLAHIDVLAVRGWIESLVTGHSESTEMAVKTIEHYGVFGRRALLVKEGLLPQ